MRDRLSEQVIIALVTAFKHDSPKPELAQRHGIALRSLKRLLQDEGVKRRSWNDIQA